MEQCLEDRFLRYLAHVEHVADRPREQGRFGQCGKLHEPHAVFELVDPICTELLRESRLADAAGSGDRDQAVTFERGKQRR